MASFKNSFGGARGFEVLRKYVKQGGDFCKDISVIMQERAELELNYSKGLLKLSHKITKASKDIVGTTGQVWKEISSAMEEEADIHKVFSVSLLDDIVKQLKHMAETHHKNRKTIETPVDKVCKLLSERRSEEAKLQKLSFSSCRDNERAQDLALDNRGHKGKSLTDKDVNKLTVKRKKAEEGFQKADQEYYTACLKAEMTRQDWETSIFRASEQLQRLEEEKLHYMQDFVQKYSNHLSLLGPNMIRSSERLTAAVGTLDLRTDMMLIVESKGTGLYVPEQILPDFYAEDTNLSMKRERRRNALEKLQLMMKHDLELQKRSREGLENLSRGLRSSPNFGNVDAQQDVQDKLKHSQCTMIYLEVSCYKIQCVLTDLEGCARPTHHLSSQLRQFKDKQGMSHTILKLPITLGQEQQRNSAHSNSSGWDSGASTPSSNDGPPPAYNNVVLRPTSRHCRAIYMYEANMDDELTIRPGDVITLHERSNEDWWKGELNGHVGVFPATYVEEIT